MLLRAVGLLALFLLPSCFALSVLGDHRAEVINPFPSAERGRLATCCDGEKATPASEFVAKWGTPDEVLRDSDGAELWRYDCGWRWNGFFTVFVVVPFGLGVPVGNASLTLVVHDAQVVEVRSLCGGFERLGVYLGPPVRACAGWRYAYTASEHGTEIDNQFIEME